MNREEAWRLYRAEADGVELAGGSRADMAPNGSLEEGDGAVPLGWHLVGGSLGESTEWQRSGGVDGGRCLRISPHEGVAGRGGGASWQCDPIPVTGGAEYLFRCAMKRDGNRHWAHACAISWVSLVFHDASGKLCAENAGHTPFVIVRCRKTADWVEGWRYLRAPKDARSLRVGFRIERGHPDLDDARGFRKFWHGDIDTGNWWIDAVRLERMPLETASWKGALTIRIPDRDARLRVADAAGKTFAPEGSLGYQWNGGCFHALRDEVRLSLPPGEYTVEGLRGFQRKPFRESVNVVEGQDTTVVVSLPRIVDLPAAGWYEGDHHNHLSFHGETRHPLMTIDDACRVARGEGLDFLSFCGEIVDQHAYAAWREAGRPGNARPDGAIDWEDFICSISHEVTQDLLGHVCLVNAPGRVAPGHPWWLSPTNAEMVDQVRQGDRCLTEGAVVMAHPYDSLTTENLFEVLADPRRTGLNRELPVDVALGYINTMDFLAVEEPADLDLRFRDYFRLLNLGLSVGVSAASDAYADQGTELVGTLRTVVWADAFTMNAIARGYRMQKTLATNGPIIQFSARGGGVGDTIVGPAARFSARAYSNWGLTKLEIVAGGDVIADATPGADGWATIEHAAVFARSGWAIARAWGPGHPALNMLPVAASQHAARGQWAVTSPIYVTVPNKPPAPRKEDAAYFVRWIDASCEAIRGRMAVLQGQGPYGPVMRESDVKAALELFARGRKVYERFL